MAAPPSPGSPAIRDLLRKVSIFAHLDPAGLGAIERLMEIRHHSGEAVIAGQEDPGDNLFVLVQGKVKVVLYGDSGREIILSIFKSPGDFFGEMSLLDNQPRSATILAVEPSTLLVLKRRDFQAHLEAHPRSALAVLTQLSRRLRHADEVIGNLALLDVYGRVARKLREMAEADGEETEEGVVIRQRPTQQEMAATIGTSRETVSRVLSGLARHGHIEMTGRRLLIRRGFLVEQAGED